MVPHTFIIAYLLSLACAKPVARTSMVVHELRQTIPSGFVDNGAANDDMVLNLRAALVQSNITGLEQELYAVSTPGSARYGQHLTKEEVESFVKPLSATVTLVNQWFDENNVSVKTISPAGDWLEFSITVGQANDLLDADFHNYMASATGQQSTLTLAYSIPSSLKGHLDLVHPTITFPSSPIAPRVSASNANASKRASNDVPSSCDSVITPTCLQDLYGIPTTLATQSSNVIAVSAFYYNYANEADLETFLTEYRPDLSPSTTWTERGVDGGINGQTPIDAGVEANLDTQYTIGVASGVPEFLLNGGTTNGSFLPDMFFDMANYLLAESNPPSTFTTSYGSFEELVSGALANQLCNAYMQLGARGVSVLFASGDGGVGDGTDTCTTFVPTFPGGCPYVTSVGATTGITETAASLSSGGFSTIFTRPSYQSDAVSSYLTALGSTNAGLYNITGRGFPDVSAQGMYYQVIVDTALLSVDGTSAASPTFASVIALLNDELMAAGKNPLGFLNPLLYSSASALNDITSGDNPGCNTNGFPAMAGWDPVTGLGTPNYANLRTAVGL